MPLGKLYASAGRKKLDHSLHVLHDSLEIELWLFLTRIHPTGIYLLMSRDVCMLSEKFTFDNLCDRLSPANDIFEPNMIVFSLKIWAKLGYGACELCLKVLSCCLGHEA